MKKLLYPSCGIEDALHFLEMFVNEVDEFIFADLNFRNPDVKKFEDYLRKFGKIELIILGSFAQEYIRLYDLDLRRYYRKIAPAYAIFEFKVNNKTKRIILRKGFGQFAILELNNESLDIFIHRGDSMGEGGSGVFYLGHKKLKYEPISNIFDKLVKKLKNGALIVSDGSNITFKKLKRFYRKIASLSKEEVEALLPIEVEVKNIVLKAEKVIDRRYNHTLIWRVKKETV